MMKMAFMRASNRPDRRNSGKAPDGPGIAYSVPASAGPGGGGRDIAAVCHAFRTAAAPGRGRLSRAPGAIVRPGDDIPQIRAHLRKLVAQTAQRIARGF